MRKVFVLSLLTVGLLTGGCGVLGSDASTLLGFEKDAPSRVEPPPRPDPTLVEHTRQAAAFVEDATSMLAVARDEVAGAVIEQTALAAAFVSDAMGSPVERIEVTPGESAPALPAVVEAGRKELARDRRRETEWRKSVTKESRTVRTSGWRLQSPMLFAVLGALGLSGMLAGVVGWLWKYRKTVLQLVPGVQAFLDTSPPQESARLKETLSAVMDERAKRVVKDVKKAR